MSDQIQKSEGTAPAPAEKGKLQKVSENPVERIRALAANRLHLMKRLSDHDARLASIIFEELADVLDGKQVAHVEPPAVVKRIQ